MILVKHYSVLLDEAIAGLAIKPDGIYVDGTLGYGGHSSEILKRLNEQGHLYAFDQDKEALAYSKERLSKIGDNFTLVHSNFVNMKEELANLGINKVDGIIFDLGLSSPQIDNKERGFTFMNDAKLDMRMDQDSPKTAADVVNDYSEKDLTNIFFLYGEEKMSRQIAHRIVVSRQTKRIETTKELVDIIAAATKAKYFNTKHPERQIFQAIRIEVNSELSVLKHVLPDAINLLNKNGRISVITFHSLEDRITKQIFKQASEVDELVKGLPVIPAGYQINK